MTEIIGTRMTTQDQLLIYFAGHGIEGAEMLIAPYDCDAKKIIRTAIELKDIYHPRDNTNKFINSFKSLLIILDTCYAGTATLGQSTVRPASAEHRPREIIMSCESSEQALDESMFAAALCDFLATNGKESTFSAENLSTFIKPGFEKRMAAKSHQQKIRYGPAPSEFNAQPAFNFYLSDEEKITTTAFVEGIIKYLNFEKERNFIRRMDLDAATINHNYFIISSASHFMCIERTRCNILSKELIRKKTGTNKVAVDFFRSACFHFTIREGANINNFLLKINRNLGNSTISEDIISAMDTGPQPAINPEPLWQYFIEKIGNWLKAPDDDARLFKQKEFPFLLALTFEHLDGDSISAITSFVNELISRIEQLKKNEAAPNNTWSPLIINLISDCSEIKNDNDKNYVNELHLDDLLKRYGNPAFKFFDRVDDLEKYVVDTWVSDFNDELGNDDIRTIYRQDILKFFDNNKRIGYYDFIKHASDVIYKGNPKKYNDIYPTLFFNKF